MRPAAPENLVIAGSMTRSENGAPAPACTVWTPALSSWLCRTWVDRRVRDTVMFAVTDEDWPEVRARLDARLAAFG